MAENSRPGRLAPTLTLLVILSGTLLVCPTAGASNQETTTELNTVSVITGGEFSIIPAEIAEIWFSLTDSDENVVWEGPAGEQEILLSGTYTLRATVRTDASDFIKLPVKDIEFNTGDYSIVELQVTVWAIEGGTIVVTGFLVLSALRMVRRTFGRLSRTRPTSTTSGLMHIDPTDDMLAEQDPKSDADLVDVLEEHIESFSHGLHTGGAFLPWNRGYLLGWMEWPPREDQTNLDIPFWPPDDTDSIGEDVWYQFKETESGTMVVELDSEVDYDTRIPLYKLTYEERKSAEEESLPEQESVDDPYYPGAPGDRELAIKYGLEWIRTPEEEKVLRELWEKENERRKKRGSILISWLVWKEMFKQEQKDLACNPEDSCEGSEQEQGSGTRVILPNNTETPPEAPPPSNQDNFPPPAQDDFLSRDDENFCYYHADGCDAEKLREHVKKFIEEHAPERLESLQNNTNQS